MQLVAPAEITSSRILAIDDEEANVLLLRSVLEREGYWPLQRSEPELQLPKELGYEQTDG